MTGGWALGCVMLLATLPVRGVVAPVVLYDDAEGVEVSDPALTGVEGVQLESVSADGDVPPAAGTRMLRMSGRRPSSDGRASAYLRLWTGDYEVTPNTRLSYCVRAALDSVDTCFAVDLDAPSFYPDNLRDQPDARDQHGVRAHPTFGWQMGRNLGQWSYREISLAPLAGKHITGARAAWDGGQGGGAGEFVGYFDEVFLWEADGDGEARAAELRRRYGWEAPPADLTGYPAPVAPGGWTETPPLAAPVESPAQRTARGMAALRDNGYFAFENGEAFLPWGMFGSEIHTSLSRGETPLSGPGPWWSHVPDAGGPGHNSEPSELNEADWARYFDFCRLRGINALRLFTYGHTTLEGEPGYYFSLDAVGRVHPVLWRKLDRFMQVGYEHGIRFLFILLASPDWMPYVRHARAWNPANQMLHEARRQYIEADLTALRPHQRRFLVDEGTVEIANAYDNRAVFEDPDVAACVEDYLRDLLPRLAHDPRVFAVEIMNEAFPLDQGQWAWDHVTRLCRELAPGRPVVLSHTLGSGVQTIEHADFVRTAGLDAYNWHSYLTPNSAVTEELALNCAYYNAPVPGFPTEGPAYYGGADPATVDERQRQLAIRDYLWLPLATGCPGSILWSPENAGIAPSEWQELGLFHRVLAQITREVDFARLRRQRPPVGLSLDLGSGLRGGYSGFLFQQGTPVEFAPDGDGFEVFVDRSVPASELARFAGPVRLVGGGLCLALVGQDGRQVVAYVPDYVARQRGGQLRRVELLLDLPADRYRVTVFDLDSEEMAGSEVAGHGRLVVSQESDHDYVLLLTAMEGP